MAMMRLADAARVWRRGCKGHRQRENISHYGEEQQQSGRQAMHISSHHLSAAKSVRSA
jgi:hypothetical protein